ncbi:MAG: LPS assembly lipoprotein LptE [Ignavibacteria bacterium]|nr:LPS assembly lipoprotein LptE [Ignavibacteria bacterium]
MRLLFIVILLFFYGCNYSFRGASPPEGIKTIYIPLVKDESNFGEPTLPEYVTVTLKNKFINDNTLEYAEKTRADGMIECTVKNIRDEAQVVQGNEQVSRRKITINVTVNFINLKTEKVIWNKEFSNWGEYDSSGGGFSKRDEGLQTAVDKICEDILIETISNW